MIWPWQKPQYFIHYADKDYTYAANVFLDLTKFLKQNKIKYHLMGICKKEDREHIADGIPFVTIGKKDLNLVLLVFGNYFDIQGKDRNEFRLK